MSAVAQCAQDETVCHVCKYLLRLSKMHVFVESLRETVVRYTPSYLEAA